MIYGFLIELITHFVVKEKSAGSIGKVEPVPPRS
jgi:hypothetical protein